MEAKNMITAGEIESVFGEYEKEDYLTSREPYAVLHEATKDMSRMDRNIVVNAVKQMAKNVGCSNTVFMEMLSASEEQQERVMPDSGGFPGIEKLLDGKTPDYGEYLCSADGIFLYDEKSGSVARICGHPVFPTRRYVNREKKEEQVDISYYLDGKWDRLKMIPRQVVCEASQISGFGKSGLDFNSENAREMVKYLSFMMMQNRDIIPCGESIDRMGWVEDRGFAPYIPDIVYSGERNYQEMFSAIHQQGDFKEWLKVAKAVRANRKNPAGRFMLAASVASAVLPWTCNQSFMVHLWSPVSGTGKTLALMLAASVWADPAMGRYIKPLNSSDTALEQMENFCNNLPLCLDELESVRIRDFDGLIYRLGEGMGRSRATKSLGIREQSRWTNIILTNGEHPITDDSRGGAINRVISIESTGPVFPGGHENMSRAAETMMNNYGHAGAMIAEKIRADPKMKDTIRTAYGMYRNKLLEKATGKQASYGAALMVGDWLLEMMVVRDGQGLTTEDVMAVLATPEMADMNLRAQNIVRDFIAMNASNFARENDPVDLPVRAPVCGKMMNDGRVCIIQSSLQKVLNEANFNFRAFMKWCLYNRMLYTHYNGDTERHWSITVKMPGMKNNVRAICFLPEFFRDTDRQSGMTIVEPEPGMPFVG